MGCMSQSVLDWTNTMPHADDPIAHIPKLVKQLLDAHYWLRFPDRQVVAESLQAAWDRVATLKELLDELRDAARLHIANLTEERDLARATSDALVEQWVQPYIERAEEADQRAERYRAAVESVQEYADTLDPVISQSIHGIIQAQVYSHVLAPDPAHPATEPNPDLLTIRNEPAVIGESPWTYECSVCGYNSMPFRSKLAATDNGLRHLQKHDRPATEPD